MPSPAKIAPLFAARRGPPGNALTLPIDTASPGNHCPNWERLVSRTSILTFAMCGLAFGTVWAQAQNDELKAIIRKSMEAHGGEKVFAKFKALSSKSKGTMIIAGVKLNVTNDVLLQRPNKFKKVMTLEKDGKSADIVQVYDGKSFWVKNPGSETKEITDEKILKELKESLEAEGGGSLPAYLKPPYELDALGEVKVKDKDAVGIRVSKKGSRDLSYYFDKKTNLIVKVENRGLDPTGQKEVGIEKFILAYQEKEGMKVAKRVVIYSDGELFMDLELLDVQVFEKLDNSTFAKP
jgi:outer membrane lipoprotein-sorting protein